MPTIVLLSGSPGESSRTEVLLHHIAAALRRHGHSTRTLAVRDLPADALLRGDLDDPALRGARDALLSADGVVVGTPVHKATYSGLLKVFIDLLPMDTLHGLPVLPVVTGGSDAHVLALDCGLKPLLTALGATRIAPGRFVHSSGITPATGSAPGSLGPSAEAEVRRVVDDFLAELPPAERERASALLAPASAH